MKYILTKLLSTQHKTCQRREQDTKSSNKARREKITEISQYPYNVEG